MMARRAPGTVRYRSGDNRLLRLALLEAWDWNCYWHRHPLTFSDADIDHIIPQDVSMARLAELVHRLGLPADFEVHRPANLAPICGPCNTEKSNRDYLDVPMVLDKLHKALSQEQRVIRRVQDQATAGAVARNLLNAATADLSGPKVRREFRANAPAIVQRLAEIDEDAVNFRVTRTVEIDLGNGYSMPTTVTLDARGRTAATVIEDVCGCTLADALHDGLISLTARVDAYAEASIQRHQRESDNLSAVELVSPLGVELAVKELRRDGARLIVSLAGELHGSYSATLTRNNRWGDGTDDLPLTAYVDLGVAITVSWDLVVGPGTPDQAQAEITADLLQQAHDDLIVDDYYRLEEPEPRNEAPLKAEPPNQERWEGEAAVRLFHDAFGRDPGCTDEGGIGTTPIR